jgi:uncharacterized membrane protein YbhN (UPF0104 family)
MGAILMIAAVAFIINRIIKLNIDFTVFLTARSLALFAAATLLYVFAVFILANCWRMILSFLSKKDLDIRKVNYIFIKTNLFKYIPGNVMHLVGRNLLGSDFKIPQSAIAASTVIEIILMCALSFALAVLTDGVSFFAVLKDRARLSGGLLLILAAALFLAAICIVFLLRKKIKERLSLLTAGLVFKCLVGYALFFLILILSYTIFLASGSDISDMYRIASAVTLSWLIGFVTIGSPGGIGVREAVLLMMLSGEYDESAVIYAAIMQRFSMIVGEIILFVAAALYEKIKR